MKEHRSGWRGAYWTAAHPPIKIIYTEDLGVIPRLRAERRENRMVRALMKQRGINKVRGGDLTSVDEYIARFGYIFDKEGWRMATGVFFITLVLLFVLIDMYFL